MLGCSPRGFLPRVVENARHQPERFKKQLGELFSAMATGGDFGPEAISYFNGDLFADVQVLDLTRDTCRPCSA